MPSPLTRAERTGYRETSLHADVIAFLDELRVPRESFGVSPEGRDLPLITLGERGPRVLVICGIHAGEVEGKEAMMMLLRDLLGGAHAGILDHIRLAVVPLFNPDGNDRIDPAHRALDIAKREGQMGPASGVGTRVNASGVNLNRDYLKQSAPEMRLLQANVMQRLAPDLTIDCHATNGSVHRFDLTYDIPHTVDSGRGEPIAWMRDTFLPDVCARMSRPVGWYGNFVEDEGGEGEGWMTYTHHPRFGSNYRGLTGRCDLLLETYAYIPFEERVATTYEMLVHALKVAGERGDVLRAVVAEAESPRDRVAVRYALQAFDEPATILTRAPRTLDGAPIEVTIPHLARFVGSKLIERPMAYAVPAAIGAHLARHGLPVRVLDAPEEMELEIATVESVRTTDPRAILEAAGETVIATSWARRTESLPAGTAIVDTSHRLGAIAVYQCEPESDDGLVASGLIPVPAAGDRYPAVRVLQR